MSDINITIEGGASKRLLTAGKYCDSDIVITASSGASEIWTFTMEDGSEVTKEVVVA